MSGEAHRARERQRIAAIIRRRVRDLADLGEPEDQDTEAILAAHEHTMITIARWLERGAHPGALWL